MNYLIEIFENSCKDNWLHHPPCEESTKRLISQFKTDNPKQAVIDFKDRYIHEDEDLYLDVDSCLKNDEYTMKKTERGFVIPTEEEVELWKVDKFELFSVEYILKISKIEDTTTDEILEILGGDIEVGW